MASNRSGKKRCLSVVLVNWNQTDANRECLRRLTNWSRLDPSLWLVDNNSDDVELSELTRSLPRVNFILNGSNLGWGGANNAALRRIDSEFVLLLNSDARMEEQAAEILIDKMRDDRTLAAVAPSLLGRNDGMISVSVGGRDVTLYVRTHMSPSEIDESSLSSDEPFEVDYLPGAAVIWRTNVLRELGFFEESYFFGGEMAELCERARDHGYRIAVLPRVRAEHDLRLAAQLRDSLYPYYILRNRFLFVRRRRHIVLRLPLFAYWALYAVLRASRSVLRLDLVDARLAILGAIDGVLGRYGNQNSRVLRG